MRSVAWPAGNQRYRVTLDVVLYPKSATVSSGGVQMALDTVTLLASEPATLRSRSGVPYVPATDNGPGALEDAVGERIKLSRKEIGAYYTPEAVAASLVMWAVRHGSDRMLDPACGDGRF